MGVYYLNKKVFLINSAVLVSAALLARIIGIVFRVYMSNKIGAGGIGLYQLISIIYFFIVTLVTQGVSLSVTRMVTDSLSLGDCRRAKRVTYLCIAFAAALSLICSLALFFGASFIGEFILKDTRAVLSLKILSVSLPFMAVSSCFRGFFLATRSILKSASEQLLEQVIEIAVFAVLIGRLLPLGIEYACCAIVIGTTVSEVISCIYSYFLFLNEKRKVLRDSDVADRKPFVREFMSTFAPVTGSATMRSGLSIIENVMIPKGLLKYGASYDKSLASYGLINGMVMPVITFPSAFLMSFSLLLIPEFSEANMLSKTKDIISITGRVFEITFYFSIFISGMFVCFGRELGLLIYNNETAGIYIAVLAPILPLMYLDSIVDGMLKGLGESFSYFKYNLIDSVIRVILIFILIPVMGINGLIVVIFVSEILNSTLSILKLMRVASLRMDVMKWIIKPVLAVFFPGLLFSLSSDFTALIIPERFTRTVTEIALSLLLYLLMLLLMGCVNFRKKTGLRTAQQ